jgi:hypothetical protein
VPKRFASLTLLLLLAAVALPALAAAQSAGDEQYADPFTRNQAQANPKNGSGDGNQGSSGGNSSGQPSGAGTSGTNAPTTTASTPTAANASGRQLPRTGLDLRLFAVAGVWMVLGGVALRRVMRAEPLS